MTTERNRKHLPPYVSYRTFHNFVDRLQQQGTPQRIDRSYWGDILSGSTGPQLMAAMRFLGLIDANGKPTDRLKQLVPAEGDKKTQLIRTIASDSFSFVMKGSLDLSSATYAQLEEAFHNNFSLTDDVKRKCVKFFIAMASDSGMAISPHITRHTRAAHNGTNGRSSPKKPIPRVVAEDKIPQQGKFPQLVNIPQSKKVPKIVEQLPDQYKTLLVKLVDKFPDFDPSWDDEVKQRWLISFDELFKKIIFNI
jgi:hypothetical protein